jgi:hypothetical protein
MKVGILDIQSASRLANYPTGYGVFMSPKWLRKETTRLLENGFFGNFVGPQIQTDPTTGFVRCR